MRNGNLKKVLDNKLMLAYTNHESINQITDFKWKEDDVMPLSMVQEGAPNVIKKVGGKEDTRRFLETLGFVVGGVVTVVSQIDGNMIVNVKDSRVAIGKDMANRILV